MFDHFIGWIKKLTEAGMSLLALGIVMQVIFGKAVPFIGGDIIGNISGLITSVGNAGLAGIITVAVIFWLFRHQSNFDDMD